METTTRRFSIVRKFYKRWKRLPSLTETQKLFNVSSKTVAARLYQKMIVDGLLYKEGRKFSPTTKFFEVPLLGSVRAGHPSIADNFVDSVSLDDYIIEKPNSTFTLKVNGDCLLDLGISTGDLAVIEKAKTANINDVVLVLVDNEWGLKILKEKDGKYYLDVANSKFSPIFPQSELKIYGVLKGVVKKF